VTAPSTVTWNPLSPADLPDLSRLAARVLAADGGLPLMADPSFLARRYTDDGVVGRAARADTGALLAAGAVRPDRPGATAKAIATGIVDPAARGRGIGAALLDWALATAEAATAEATATGPPGNAADAAAAPTQGIGTGTGRAVTVETESLTGPATALFASRGLRQIFAEDVLRRDLAEPPPDVALPPGVLLEPWTPALAGRFFAVYNAAFAERPGFPHLSAARWIALVTDDDEFRPDWSVLAVDPTAGDVAFVTCADGWINQVGVRPDQRGRRLGAGLVAEALRRMRAAGLPAAVLDVNLDNPARDLYLRLGFAVVGRRARFTRRRA
jgi:ribosomal protein S18 acetylase RimI-like enzyme